MQLRQLLVFIFVQLHLVQSASLTSQASHSRTDVSTVIGFLEETQSTSDKIKSAHMWSRKGVSGHCLDKVIYITGNRRFLSAEGHIACTFHLKPPRHMGRTTLFFHSQCPIYGAPLNIGGIL
ncbi:hypothetical protein FHG87_012755 [Trinorchestia longiramus]|nr:hypothetical protein FHG87_012755 [Trinorchestia longiramus]